MNCITRTIGPAALAFALCGVSFASADTLALSCVGASYGRASGSDIILHSIVGQSVAGEARSEDGSVTLQSGLAFHPLFRAAVFNDPPVITSADTVRAEEQQLFKYTATATDPDDSVLTIHFSGTGAIDWLDSAGTTVIGTPPVDEPPVSFTVTVSDGSLSDTLAVTVLTVTANQKPSVQSPTTDSTNEGEPYRYVAKGFDPEGSALTLGFEGYPSWLSVTKDTLAGTPPEGSRSATFRVLVSDERWTDTAWVSLKIREIDNPPVITSPRHVDATEHIPFSYVATATDPDNTPAISFENAPAWLEQYGDTLRGTPPEGVGSAATFTVIATDFTSSDTQDVVIALTLVNDPPKVTSRSVAQALINSPLSYTATATDPENEPVTISIEGTPDWLTVDNDSAYGTSPGTASEGSFQVIASDGEKSDTLTVALFIKHQNSPPELRSAPADTAYEDSLFVYPLIVHDPDATDRHDFLFAGLPDWLSLSGDSALVGTPSSGSDASDVFTITVTDGDKEDTHTTRIVVIHHNNPPRIVSSPATAARIGEEYRDKIRATDEEGTTVTYELTEGPEGMTVDELTGDIRWTPPRDAADSTTVTITATDADDASSSITYKVVVARNLFAGAQIDTVIGTSGDIAVVYELDDHDEDTLSLVFQYLTPSGWKSSGNLAGKTDSIVPEEYADTLYWQSKKDIPDTATTRVRLIVRDEEPRTPAEWDATFTVNNTPVLRLAASVRDTAIPAADARTIDVAIEGGEVDPATVNRNTVLVEGVRGGKLRVDKFTVGGSKITIGLDSIPLAGDTLTVTMEGNIRDDYGKGIDGDGDGQAEGGEDSYVFSLRTLLPGDFDGNDSIGLGDLSYLAEYWNASARGSDSIVECGPATGSLPWLRLAPDGVFDFEDLFLFVRMWRWFNDADTVEAEGELEKAVAAAGDSPAPRGLARRRSPEVREARRVDLPPAAPLQVQRITAEVETDPYRPRISLAFSCSHAREIVAVRYRAFFSPHEYRLRETRRGEFLAQDGGQVIALKKHRAGMAELQAVRLAEASRGASGSGTVATMLLEPLGEDAGAVTVAYELIDADHRIVEAGSHRIDIEASGGQAVAPASGVVSVRAVPNPAAVAAGRSALAVDGPVDPALRAMRGEGGCAFLVNAVLDPRGSESLEAALSILDIVGNPVASAAAGELSVDAPNYDPSTRTFTIFWDGRTDSGRRVQPGIYQAVFSWRYAGRSGRVMVKVGIE